ncbi:MAG: ATP-binding cassette domain-containing protein [Gammaproteobacteria bacterium]|nr:ATP-binding cassette domain-containing protein [Gammaproteobacteria bacterium]
MDRRAAESISIVDLADRLGVAVPCEGNLPVHLDLEDCVWFVEQGTIDLFLVESKSGVEQVAPQHLLRLEAGRLLPNVPVDSPDDTSDSSTLGIIAKGFPGTMLKRISTTDLNRVQAAELADHVDLWISDITDTLSRYVIHFPRTNAIARPGLTQELSPCTLTAHRAVVWVSGFASGASLFMDMLDQTDLVLNSNQPPLPLTRSSWLSIYDDVSITGRSSVSLAEEGELMAALAAFHKVALRMERLNRQLAVVDQANFDRERTMSRRVVEQTARSRLFNIDDVPLHPDFQLEDTSLADAFRIIGKYQGFEFKFPEVSPSSTTPVGLVDILDVSGVRARRVQLDADSHWWRSESSAMLTYYVESKRPVVLLPGLFGNYRLIDPVTGRSIRVTKKLAAKLQKEAWTFYRPLPTRSIRGSDLLDLALHGSRPDLVRLVSSGLAGGLVRLLPALALGIVASHIVAGGGDDILYITAVALVGFGIIGVLLCLVQNIALMRFEARASSRLEAAIWDRLMRLPTKVLHQQRSGDLAMSGMTFQNLRDGFQGVAANSLLSVIFLTPVFGIVFFFDSYLGLVVLGFSIVSLALSIYIGVLQIKPQGKMISAMRSVTGLLFEIIGGIAKLRVENAEGSAFAMWAQEYRSQKRAEIELSKRSGHLRAFGNALPLIAAAALLLAVMVPSDRQLPLGDFLIVYSVFMAFQYTVAKFGESFSTIAGMLPALSQMQPLLEVVPEVEAEGEYVPTLRGEILFDRVCFRYDANGPLILDDVTIHARPGEFIAITGESGSGKSTLFRLALGLNRPTSGAVYYDNRDLKHLNLKQVRRQIGAVPQSVRLMPQDIWDNIVTQYDQPTTEQVWQSARAAKMETQIKAMPMGLMTMVGTSGAVLSGGESQRISIARVLLGNPRIMLFDEATNWLDNESQAEVMQNFALLSSTRILIAHRLSTLKQADRIYVLRAGKVVQSGSFDTLMEVEGEFRELIKRQTV